MQVLTSIMRRRVLKVAIQALELAHLVQQSSCPNILEIKLRRVLTIFGTTRTDSIHTTDRLINASALRTLWVRCYVNHPNLA